MSSCGPGVRACARRMPRLAAAGIARRALPHSPFNRSAWPPSVTDRDPSPSTHARRARPSALTRLAGARLPLRRAAAPTDGHVRSRDGAHTRREKPCDRAGPPARSRGHLLGSMSGRKRVVDHGQKRSRMPRYSRARCCWLCRAPSVYNSQPWRWVAEGGVLHLFVDPRRIAPRSRQLGHGKRLSVVGRCSVTFALRWPRPAGTRTSTASRTRATSNHLATIDFSPAEFITSAQCERADAILRRGTDRLPFAAPRIGIRLNQCCAARWTIASRDPRCDFR